jgi:Kunitz/Bovine pancreatic trypsin inhibitor domain
MMRSTIRTLIAIAAVFLNINSVSAVDERQNVCLKLIEQKCNGEASAEVMDDCLEKGIVTCVVPDHCLQPSKTGMCRAAFPRFFFDATSGSCESFIYGGCGGNENNFDTKKACEHSCSGLRYCGGTTGASCPKNYQCVEQKEITGETGLCVMVPEEKRTSAEKQKKVKHEKQEVRNEEISKEVNP